MIPAEPRATLSVSISDGMTVEFPLGLHEVRIGRGREADLLLLDPSVSRLHARIFRVGTQYFLSDRSKNGTFVSGTKVTQLHLENGMAFTVGDVKDRISASILHQFKNPRSEIIHIKIIS